jgi:hypothetical protein
MPLNAHVQLALPGGGGCRPCPLPATCGESGTSHACGPETVNGVLHHSHEDFAARLAEINGLEFDITHAREQNILPLPDFVPQVDPWTASPKARAGVVAITWSRWGKRGGVRYRSLATMAARLGLGPDANLILLLIAKDQALERLWADRERFLEALGVLRPDMVVAPGLSVYPGRSALEQRYGMVRSLRLFGWLQDRGFTAIPSIDWERPRDRADWARWLNDNPISTFSVDLQCIGADLRWTLAELAELRASLLRQPPRLLINGRRSVPDFADLIEVWPEISFTNDPVPIVANGHGTEISPSGASRRVRHIGGRTWATLWPDDPWLTTHERFDREIATLRRMVDDGRREANRRRAAA